MNQVLNSFQITHPTAIQTSLPAAALFSKFDPSGRWIAAGKQNGSVIIWDLVTKAPVRVLDGHVRGVTSVDWSRYGRYVLTSSKDWNVIVWDLAERCLDPLQRMRTVRFDSGVLSASFHPRNSKVILALLTTGELFITDLRKEYRGRTELCDLLYDDREREREEGEELEGPGPNSSVPPPPNSYSQSRNMKQPPITVARFDVTGKYVFAGTASGMILVFHTRTKTMVGRHKVSGAGTMKSFDFTRNGRRLVSNSSDRTLRQFTIPNYLQPSLSSSTSTATSNTPANASPIPMQATASAVLNEQELEPTHKFTDPINKTAWHVMGYSPDGEWLAGGSADPATHKIYIWDLSNDGQFSTALDGGREPLAHIHWHPAKSLIASTTTHGNVLIWHCPKAERWGAFAGGFEEVDENIEYEERENEFDIEDEEVIQERKMKAEEEEVDIDSMRSPIIVLKKSSVNNNSNNLNSNSKSITSSNTNNGDNHSYQQHNNPSQSKPDKSNNTHPRSSFDKDHHRHSPTTTTKNEDNSKGKEYNGRVEGAGRKSSKDADEDMAWAENDPDEDEKGWKMHVSKAVAELAEELGV